MNDNEILLIQPLIADAVDSQLPIGCNISEDEFEEVCAKVYATYIGCIFIDEPDIWDFVDKELTKRGYKEE